MNLFKGEERRNCPSVTLSHVLSIYKKRFPTFGMKIYFAHSMDIYFTRKEKKQLKLIRKDFPLSEIINPSDSEHKHQAKGLTDGEIMRICLEIIKNEEVEILVFSALKINREWFIGKGVYREVILAEQLGKCVFFINKKELTPFYRLELYDPENRRRKYARVKTTKF